MLVVSSGAVTALTVFWRLCWEKLVHREKESASSQLAVKLPRAAESGS